MICLSTSARPRGPIRAVGCQRNRKRANKRANRRGSASALPDGKEIPGCTGVDDWPNRHSWGRNLPYVVRDERNGVLTHNEREGISETLSVSNKTGSKPGATAKLGHPTIAPRHSFFRRTNKHLIAQFAHPDIALLGQPVILRHSDDKRELRDSPPVEFTGKNGSLLSSETDVDVAPSQGGDLLSLSQIE